MQFSLKLILAAITLCGLFFFLVKLAGFQTAFGFSLMLVWLLSPVWVTFVVLYWQQSGRVSKHRSRHKRS